jgi:hypothetical protein
MPVPGADHDERRRGIGGQAKGVRLLHISPDRAALRDALGEEGRGNAEAPPGADL